MKINVWKRYEGNRAKRPIEEGVYDASDRKLFGLGSYLIDNGNAREVVEPQAVSIKPQEEVSEKPAKKAKRKR